MTNKQKWDEAIAVLEKKEQCYLNSILGDDRPEFIFHATVDEIKTINIDNIKVYVRVPFVDKRITNNDLQKLNEVILDFDNQEKNILFCYKSIHKGYTASGAYKLKDIKEDKRLSFNHDDLIPIQKELHEKYAPREGYAPCTYCGIQVPKDQLVPYTIIFQNSRPDPFSRGGWRKFVDRKTNLYCSKTCGVHDQMAHEG